MRPFLVTALEDIVGEDQLRVMTDALTLLESLDLSAPSDEIQTIVEIQDSMSDNAIMVSRINDVIYIAYEEAFASFGISLIDNTPLAFKVALLQAVTSLEHYIIPEEIKLLYQAPFGNEEIIANIVPIFSSFTLEQALEYVVEVSDALIQRIEDVIDARLLTMVDPDQPPPVADNVKRVARLNRLITTQGSEQVSVVYKLATAGVRTGRPLNALLEQNFEALEGFETDQLVSELVALVVFSDEPLTNIKAKVMELIADFQPDLSSQRRMDVALNKVLSSAELES